MRNPTKSPTTDKALPVKFKVEIKEGSIFQNGVDVGYMYSAGGSVWVNVTVDGKKEFFARVRSLRNSMSKAKTMVKDVLSRMTPAEYVVAYNTITNDAMALKFDPTRTKSPLEIHAEVLGFDTTIAFTAARNPDFAKTLDSYKSGSAAAR